MNERVADQRVLRGTAATIESKKLDGNGEPVAPAGAVTVTVTKADGTVVFTAQSATTDTTTTGRVYRALTAAQTANLNLLTCVWTDTDSTTWSTLVEIVGGFYFSVPEARASDPALGDTVKYTEADILAARREVEDEFERICQVAFVPRYRRVQVDGPWDPDIELPDTRVRSVVSVRQYTDVAAGTYTAYTVSNLADLVLDDSRWVRHSTFTPFSWGVGNLTVEYEHGWDRPQPEVKRAALTRLRHRLNYNKTGIPDRATSFAVADGGTFRLDSAGADKTGIPEVDAVLARYTVRDPGLA